eukprot:TRINITY_DN73141_c0_g1_i1.p1 TRINITY_DN73141_c0_g1~~TRINITY_DN73141_c0_g1_i1.p1  ORF type:complete len:208 (-),score=33.19 TRINITY_DN73141_c0_g1_i1:44-667(-)
MLTCSALRLRAVPLRLGPKVFDGSRLALDLEAQLRSQEAAGQPCAAALSVFGTNATKIVIRSILAAEDALNERGGQSPRRLALVPRRLAAHENDEAGKSGLELHLRAVRGLPPAVRGEITVARESNLGKLAGAIAKRIREDGAACVRGVGAVALRHSLKATAIASGYLDERGELCGRELAALPRLEVPEEGAGPFQSMLTVYRLAED